MRILVAAGLLAAILTPPRAGQARPSEPGAFLLEDFLGRTWRNELVRFPLPPSQAASVRGPLLGPDGTAVPYQVTISAGVPTIEFLADLNPFEKRAYRFTRTSVARSAPSDLRVEETAERIRVINSRIGVSIRKHLTGDQAPIESLRLASGRWIGDSSIDGLKAESYTARVTDRGPVAAEVVCTVGGAARVWTMRLRVEANEPAVLVDETSSLAGNGAVFQLRFDRNFSPSHVFYRLGKASDNGREGKLAAWKIPIGEPATAFVLEPWLHWWERERQGTWFGLYDENAPDLIAIATRAADVWVEPGPIGQAVGSQTSLMSDRNGLTWTLPVRAGARKWMIEALDKSASLAEMGATDPYRAPLPQQYQMKHDNFPLDEVKDYVVRWPDNDGNHPRLVVTERDLPELCGGFRPDPAKLAGYRAQAIDPQHLDGPLAYYLCTRDPALGRHLAEAAVSQVQNTVDMFLRQDFLVTLGFAPHIQTRVLTSLTLADVVWSTDHLSGEQRQRLKAQIAFLGYLLSKDSYWSPPRGFHANPNMTTAVAAYRAALGAMISSHPKARSWLEQGVNELRSQLNRWSDDGGGWLEAPHYAMLSYDYLLGVFLMAHNAGFSEDLYDPRMRSVIEWFAQISTPPDAALQGKRHLPPIGNTYLREPTGEFGLVARLWKAKDPAFASTMQWMHLQQGAPTEPGLGGFYPMLAGYRQLLIDASIAPVAPAYGSRLFPETGVSLRAHFPSARETYLYLIAGANHAHYDQDSGSVTIWGKGRIVADDFGYEGETPADDHNMLVTPAAAGAALMRTTEFTPGTHLDYVRAVKNDAWTRQIVLVKDDDPLGPNYFVIADTLANRAAATWRLWLTAGRVVTNTQGATAIGNDDVDTDIYFAASGTPTLTTETKTRTSWGLSAGVYGRASATQTGLIATNGEGSGVAAIVYPRLKTESTPTFTSLAGGRVIRIQGAFGTDYVLLSAVPFSYDAPDISFRGTVGAVQVRGGLATLALGAAGRLTAFGKSLSRG